jgi:hypothetical protein
LAIPCIQPMAMFCLTCTLFENGGTLDVMGRLEELLYLL